MVEAWRNLGWKEKEACRSLEKLVACGGRKRKERKWKKEKKMEK